MSEELFLSILAPVGVVVILAVFTVVVVCIIKGIVKKV